MAGSGPDSSIDPAFADFYEAQRRATRAAAEPILADLRAAGLDIDEISDLLNEHLDYERQLPVLIDWIPRCANLRVREVLVRALAVPAARRTAAADTLLREFETAPSSASGYRWAVALALTGAARPQDAEAVVRLFADRSYGTGRQELARVIARLRPPEALAVLVAALDDDDVAGHAVEALGFLGDPGAIPRLETMAGHPRKWVRREAARAIAKIERKRSRG